jgi:hypothetical protein
MTVNEIKDINSVQQANVLCPWIDQPILRLSTPRNMCRKIALATVLLPYLNHGGRGANNGLEVHWDSEPKFCPSRCVSETESMTET